MTEQACRKRFVCCCFLKTCIVVFPNGMYPTKRMFNKKSGVYLFSENTTQKRDAHPLKMVAVFFLNSRIYPTGDQDDVRKLFIFVDISHTFCIEWKGELSDLKICIFFFYNPNPALSA